MRIGPKINKKTVVIVAPDFAPSSYPPALRVRFFAQHLPEFGWKPIVLATAPEFYEWSVDPENERLLPVDLEVIRTRALSPRLTRKIGIGDLGIRSLWHHWRELNRICRTRKVDLIFIPVPPNPTMILGRLAHDRFDIPYVIDYIDPVLTDYYWKLPRSQRPPKYTMAYMLASLIEPFALKRVSRLVGVDNSYTSGAVQRYQWLTHIETAGIPYGGEPNDFVYLQNHPRANQFFDRTDGRFHLSYVGRGGIDILPVLRTLFKSLKMGLQQQPDLFSRVRFHFVGTTYAHRAAGHYQVLPIAQELGVDSIVEEHPGRVAYLDAIQILLDSHGLLILGSDSAHYTASKLFPSILADRPLLAIFHEESSVVKIMRDTGAGQAITFSSKADLETKTEVVLDRLREILVHPTARSGRVSDAFEPYTARAATAHLAEVFDSCILPEDSTR